MRRCPASLDFLLAVLAVGSTALPERCGAGDRFMDAGQCGICGKWIESGLTAHGRSHSSGGGTGGGSSGGLSPIDDLLMNAFMQNFQNAIQSSGQSEEQKRALAAQQQQVEAERQRLEQERLRLEAFFREQARLQRVQRAAQSLGVWEGEDAAASANLADILRVPTRQSSADVVDLRDLGSAKPGTAVTNAARGVASRMHEIESAIRAQIAAHADDPKYCAAQYMFLSQLLHARGDDAAAIAMLNKAVSLSPPTPQLAKLMEAKALADAGEQAGAEAALREYAALKPPDNPLESAPAGTDADHVGIPNLPGIALNEGQRAYGIPGLPGIYTGGPGPGSGLKPPSVPGSKEATEEDRGAPPVATTPPPAPTADAPSPPAPPPTALQQQADASRLAAAEPTPEAASVKARTGFDEPLEPPVAPSAKPSINRIVVPPPAVPASAETAAVGGAVAAAKDAIVQASDRFQTWYGDPMHREWFGDTVQIAVSPLVAYEALAAGARVVGAAPTAALASEARHVFVTANEFRDINVYARNIIYHIQREDGTVKVLPWLVPAEIDWSALGAAYTPFRPRMATLLARPSPEPEHVFLSVTEFAELDGSARNIIYHIKHGDGTVMEVGWRLPGK